MGPSTAPSAPRPPLYARAKSFLRAHPILCLALLTPGIPEYLSGSSSPVGLFVLGPVFGLLLLGNLGLYLAGVLLIREARVRWRLGWASVLTLGVAYGIAEEGLALDTLFNLHAGPVNPATAIHVFGVNWGWASQILPFHALFSVALPILLLDLALPGTRGRSLLTARGLRWTVAAYFATLSVLGVAIALTTYWMGTWVLLGSLAVIGGLVLLAKALPPDAGAPWPGLPRESPTRLFLLGLGTFPAMILVPFFAEALGLPTILQLDVAPILAALILFVLVRNVGTVRWEPGMIAFAAGLLGPVIAFGFFFALRYPIGLPLVLGVDAVAILFLWKLYHRYADRGPTALPRIVPTPA